MARSDPAVAASLRASAGPGDQRAQHGPLAQTQPRSAGDRLEPLGRRLHLELDQRPDPSRLGSGADPGRQDQAQAPGGRRAVLLADPTPQVDQLGRHAGLQRLDRLGEASLGQVAALGEADDDPDHAPAPERDNEDRADVDVVHRLGQPVVERTGDAPGGEQRFYLGDGHPGQATYGHGRATPSSTAIGSRRGPAGG